VQQDLAEYYSLAEVQLLALTGEPPSTETGRAFEVALIFLTPTTVAEAPVHAAGLARLCGSPTAGTLSTGAMTLVQQAAHELEHLDSLQAWLAQARGDLPKRFISEDAAETRAVERFRRALPKDTASHRIFLHRPLLMAAIAAVLIGCGLTRPDQLTTVWLTARLPGMSAETFHVMPGSFEHYPMHLPPYRYEEPAEGGAAEPSSDAEPQGDREDPP